MNQGPPLSTRDVLKCDPEELAVGPVHELDASRGVGHPQDHRGSVGEHAKTSFALAQRLGHLLLRGQCVGRLRQCVSQRPAKHDHHSSDGQEEQGCRANLADKVSSPRGSVKKMFPTAADNTTAISPGPTPPNHAAMVTAR